MTEEIYTPTPIKPDNYDSVAFSIKIDKLLVKAINETDDVVYQVDWTLIGSYREKTVALNHTIFFQDFELEEAPSFTSFSELTKEQVEGWIASKAPMTHLEYTVCNNFPKQVVESSKELPWN